MDVQALEARLFAALEQGRARAERALEQEAANLRGPARLLEGMRYAVLGAGKRVRPALAFAVAEAAGGEDAIPRAQSAGIGLEWIHAYSLAHDDLPALDNDDMRRGRPSLHKAFDEPLAILVGDALQAEAFRLAAQDDGVGRDATTRARQVLSLATAAGAVGMVGGQVLDMFGTLESVEAMREMHALKTGALFVAACEIGAIAAGLDDARTERWARFGAVVGLAFQLSDDMLDLAEVDDSAHEADVNLALRLGYESSLKLVADDCDEARAILREAGIESGALPLLVDWIEARAQAVRP